MLLSGCIPIYLPPYSPDLNPIEHSFGYLKREMRREGVFDTSRKDLLYIYNLVGRTMTSRRCTGWIKYDISPVVGDDGEWLDE